MKHASIRLRWTMIIGNAGLKWLHFVFGEDGIKDPLKGPPKWPCSFRYIFDSEPNIRIIIRHCRFVSETGHGCTGTALNYAVETVRVA